MTRLGVVVTKEGTPVAETWRETRAQYESKSEWRATIIRDNKIRFILEGKGAYKGRYYEHAEGQGVYPVQVEPGNLYEQLDAEEIRLVAGRLPLVSKTNQTGSH
jgi:hypothetical protein